MVGFHMDDVTMGFGMNAFNESEKSLLDFDKDMFLKTLTKTSPIGKIDPLTEWDCWREGEAKGKLIGGNLHLISWQMGTEYFPSLEDFKGSILFIEEIGSTMYNILRCLYHLKYAGIFDVISGLMIGKITATVYDEEEGMEVPSFKELFMDILKEYDFPILANMDFGHMTVNIPLPMGILASMNATDKEFSVIENAVI
jgi:muramoyltetrapeptide carboxypeptidase